MRLEDIKQLIEPGNYEVCVGLNKLERRIKEFEEDYALELNPDFQRGHVWTEEQQISYVEYFLKSGRTDTIIYFSCPFFEKGTVDDYYNGLFDYPMVCVDGLQRLTALRKALNHEIKIFGHYLNEFEDEIVFLRKIQRLKFNINTLPTKNDVIKWYLEMNTTGTPHSKEEIERVKKLLL
ncbi:DUF262 domain-containing protein [Clostridium perfringens]